MTETQTPAPEVTDGARRWTARVFQPGQQHPDDARQTAMQALRTLIREEGYTVAAKSLRREGRTAIILTDDQGSWRVAKPTEKSDGWIVEWSAEADQPVTDDVVAVLSAQEGKRLRYEIPADAVAAGGGVRVLHRLGMPVRVEAQRHDGSPIGYVFTQPLTSDEEHVEVLPGTAFVLITPDPV